MQKDSQPWTELEVRATVADYLHMLTLELSGQAYNKSAHRRKLQALLLGRSESAIELKHQNISAILRELNHPWIPGYKPLANYQQLLYEIVNSELLTNPNLDKAALDAAQQVAVLPLLDDINFSGVVVDPPKLELRAEEKTALGYQRNRQGIKRDYLNREAQNISLGKAGEEFVVAYERHRLIQLGQEKLAEKIEHVSETKGDGLGFDILSFESSGKERFIEVKTTAFAKETPFFISRNEVDFSKEQADAYFLTRLFNFRKGPQLFVLKGPVDSNCFLDPVTYTGSFS